MTCFPQKSTKMPQPFSISKWVKSKHHTKEENWTNRQMDYASVYIFEM